MSLSVVEWLAELGGVARQGTLARLVGRWAVDEAVAAGVVVREARGLYVLPGVPESTLVAARLGGVLSHTSAALHHGWAVREVPDRPHVTVPRHRRLGARRALAHVHWVPLAPGDVVDGVTSHARTLRDCLRTLPRRDALAVADSALRESGCHQLLQRVADEVAGPGSPRVRAVAAVATELAANPFESCLREVCLDVPGLTVEPQVQIGAARVDLADRRLRLVLEADSFAWHGDRAALARDARRYNALVVAGWLVLRFTYDDVMTRPLEVRETLESVVTLAEGMAEVGARTVGAA